VAEPVADRWSPQITLGMPVLIPEDYVSDLSVRLSLYRRLGDLADEEAIENFGAELIDRFGPLPDEVRYLFKVMAIKNFCRRANVEKVDAGPKGAVISFRDNSFAHPDRLMKFIQQQGPSAKVRPDMKVVFLDEWQTPEERVKGATDIMRQLAAIAEGRKAA
jgi:transcription-repair coupling factor (superfamily II helicase)